MSCIMGWKIQRLGELDSNIIEGGPQNSHHLQEREGGEEEREKDKEREREREREKGCTKAQPHIHYSFIQSLINAYIGIKGSQKLYIINLYMNTHSVFNQQLDSIHLT